MLTKTASSRMSREATARQLVTRERQDPHPDAA